MMGPGPCCSLAFEDCNPRLLPSVRQCSALERLRVWEFPHISLPTEDTPAALAALLSCAPQLLEISACMHPRALLLQPACLPACLPVSG